MDKLSASKQLHLAADRNSGPISSPSRAYLEWVLLYCSRVTGVMSADDPAGALTVVSIDDIARRCLLL